MMFSDFFFTCNITILREVVTYDVHLDVKFKGDLSFAPPVLNTLTRVQGIWKWIFMFKIYDCSS